MRCVFKDALDFRWVPANLLGQCAPLRTAFAEEPTVRALSTVFVFLTSAGVIAGSTSLTACSTGSVDDSASSAQAPIINGQLDTTRQAVVAIIAGPARCSGTIIATNTTTNVGYVLTAAHCVQGPTPQVVRQGDDYNNHTAQYNVIDYEAHPAYAPPDARFDFAMIRIAGVDASTPVIGVAQTNDALMAGSPITNVGYGVTAPNVSNSLRRQRDTTVANLDANVIITDLTNGGICSGDSGGPTLAMVGGQELVVGVHSAVTDSSCTGQGVSGRVTAVYMSFIKPFIDGQVTQSCDLCQQTATSGNGSCAGAVSACQNSSQCQAFATCLNGCNGDQTCVNNCVSSNQAGVDIYLAITDCICDTGCTAECGSEPFCANRPTCGFNFSNTTCGDCNDTNCCATTTACADDTDCAACATTATPAASCGSNALFNSFRQCLADNCSTECGIMSGMGGTGGSGGSGGAGGAGAAGGSAGTTGGAGGSGGSAGGAGGTSGAGVGGNTGGGFAGAGGDDPNGSNADAGSVSGCALTAPQRGTSDSGWGWMGLAVLAWAGARRRD